MINGLNVFAVPTLLSLPSGANADELNSLLKQRYRLNIVKWNPTSDAYPEYMLLGGDRGILAYVKYVYKEINSSADEVPVLLNSDDVLRTVSSAISDLNRPVFFVYMIKSDSMMHILFETDEQIRDRWFETSFSDDMYCPIINEAGSFENLISILLDLKKNNVHLA